MIFSIFFFNPGKTLQVFECESGEHRLFPTLKIKFGDLSLKSCGTLENTFDFLMYGNCSLWSNKRSKKCSLLLSRIICYPDPSVRVLPVPVGNGPCSIHPLWPVSDHAFTGLSVTLLADTVPVFKKGQEWQ